MADSIIFLASSLGATLAIDVAIVTISHFRDEHASFLNWTVPVASIHFVLLATFHSIFWSVAKTSVALLPFVGVAAFILVMSLVQEVVLQTIGKEPLFSLTGGVKNFFNLDDHSSKRFIVMLAISLDAPASSPVISTLAKSRHWSLPQMCLFLLLAGIAVAVVTQTALTVARLLRKRRFHAAEQMARWFVWAKFVELSVIGGFGIASPWESIWGDSSLFKSIFVMASIIGFIWIIYRGVIFQNELKNANEAIEG